MQRTLSRLTGRIRIRSSNVGRPSSARRTIRRISSARRRSHRTAASSVHRWPSRRTTRAGAIRIPLRRASRGKVPVVVRLSIALIVVPIISLTVVILILVVLLVVLLWCRRWGVLALGWRPWCSRPVECTRGGVSTVVSHLCATCLWVMFKGSPSPGVSVAGAVRLSSADRTREPCPIRPSML